jgi:hypothetical protein
MQKKGLMVRYIRLCRRFGLALTLALWLAVVAVPTPNVAAGRFGGAHTNHVIDPPQVR